MHLTSPKRGTWGLPVLVLACLLFRPGAAFAGEESPAEVRAQIQAARDQVILLRAESGVQSTWQEGLVLIQDVRPRHTLQKSFEVLLKVNRLRKARGFGPIVIPAFPAREIVPSDVFITCERLLGELRILRGLASKSLEQQLVIPEVEGDFSGVVRENYRSLSEISLALDSLLGGFGFTPADVYQQSLIVLENARFLRMSQNLLLDVPQPTVEPGHHPNHALAAAVDVLAKISEADRNLWIEPCAVPAVPRRRIESFEVYDALQIILAEQQRIKFRIGLDQVQSLPEPDLTKDFDDVLRNLKWAEALMPTFPLGSELNQYASTSLERRPADVLLVALRVEEKLELYRANRGVRVTNRLPVRRYGTQPRHVFAQTLLCLDKMLRLRSQVGLGDTSARDFPSRWITPSEVYDLAVRLEAEVDLLLVWTGVDATSLRGKDAQLKGEPVSADVHLVMSRIANGLDTFIGSKGYLPPDVLRQISGVTVELEYLTGSLGLKHRGRPEHVPGKDPLDVARAVHEVLNLLQETQQRAGLSGTSLVSAIPLAEVTPNDVYNEVMVATAEMNALKVQLGLEFRGNLPLRDASATPSHVFREVQYAIGMLEVMAGRSGNNTDQ